MNKGYGGRILPSPLEALATVKPGELPKEKATWTWKVESKLNKKNQFSLEARIANVREYVERLFKDYMRWSNNGRDLQPSYTYGAWNGTPFTADVPVSTRALFGSSYNTMGSVI